MSLEDAFAPAEAAHRDQVMCATWGHLHAVIDQHYEGKIVFAIGAYHGLVLLDAQWKGLNDSPWLYQDMQEYLFDVTKDYSEGVYQFDGLYVSRKQDNWEFIGSISQLIRL